LHAENIVNPADVQALLETRGAQSRGKTSRAARGRGRGGQIDNAVARTGRQVGAGKQRIVRDLPLNAEIAAGVRVQLDDQRLDVDLRAPRVELVDHRAQIAVHRLGRRDDQR